MMTVIFVGWSLKRPSDLLNSLAAAAFIILLWDPQQIFGASFQLSFFCVLSIGLLLPPIQRVCDNWLSPNPLLPAELVPRWRQWLNVPLRWLMTALATSLASWIGSLPLTAFYFHLLSPVTLLANLVIVPLSSLALACNVGGLLCGAWFPWASELFNHSAWLWMELMIHAGEYSTLLPKAFVYVKGPTIWDMACYYSLLVVVLSGWIAKRRAWTYTAIGCLAVLYFFRWHFEHQSMTLTVLPSNGGLTIFVRSTSQPRDLLIDPGNTNCVQFTTKLYLRAQGVNVLPSLLLTHGDVRHTGGAALVVDLFSVEQVCVSQVRFRSAVYRNAMKCFNEQRDLVHQIGRGSSLGSWTVIHPSANDHFAQADDNAVVLRGNLLGTRVLLLSDLGVEGQKALVERGDDLSTDILVTGLPSKGEAIGDALLEAASPRVIIVADSEYPSWERASPRLREHLARKRIPVIYSRLDGASTIDFRSGEWALRTMNGKTLGGTGKMIWAKR
jgi:beta-lactamase superfamily II metal-dependent hydrolase